MAFDIGRVALRHKSNIIEFINRILDSRGRNNLKIYKSLDFRLFSLFLLNQTGSLVYKILRVEVVELMDVNKIVRIGSR